MPYGETKVYFDGSHYIAIPHTTRPNLRRIKRPEEVVTVIENEEGVEIVKVDTPSVFLDIESENVENLVKNSEKSVKIDKKNSKNH